MTFAQAITLLVLAAVVAALICDKMRADVVALAGAAFLLMSGVVRPVEVQSAFASPAIIALASLFVIAYAMELSGLLDAAIRSMTALCRRIGAAGIWLLIGICGAASSFLNNTPVVVLARSPSGLPSATTSAPTRTPPPRAAGTTTSGSFCGSSVAVSCLGFVEATSALALVPSAKVYSMA